MANLIAVADGNLTDAATWATVDSTALLSVSTSGTNLSTSDQDSAVFQPGAITIDAIALKLGNVQASPAASNTLTITLRNSTDSADVVSLAYNVAELVNNAEAGRGGWYLFKLDTTYLLTAAKNYIIRLKVSATASQPVVNFMTNGTGANWQHMLRIPGTTAAPAAGDDMFVLGELAVAATWTARTVTMNQTTDTDYGAGANASEYSPSLAIGKNGTVTWGTTAATNYVLKLSGSLVIYPGGTMNMGTTGTPVPRNSSHDLQFDTASSKAYQLYVIGGAAARGTLVMQGLSRTSGKDVDRCKLAANLSAGGTTCTVDTDTGWLSGDEVAIAPTERTYSQRDLKSLTGNADASSFTIGAATYAHSGTAPTAGLIILLTRNVRARALNATYPSFIRAKGTVNLDWVRLTNMQIEVGTGASGSLNADYVSLDGAPSSYSIDFIASGLEADWHFRDVVAALTAGYAFYGVVTSSSNWTLQDVAVIGGGTGINLASLNSASAISGLYVAGASAAGITVGCTATSQKGFGVTPTTWVAHTNNGHGIDFINMTSANQFFRDQTFSLFTAWRNASAGINLSGGNGMQYANCDFDRFTAFGNTTAGIRVNATLSECRGNDWLAAGDSSFAQPSGVLFAPGTVPYMYELLLFNGSFGVASGIYVAHTTGDLSFGTDGSTYQVTIRVNLRSTVLASTTQISGGASVNENSYVSSQRHDQTDLTHWRWFPRRGTVAYEVTTYKTTAPSIKLTPTSATYKLTSGTVYFAVTDATSITVSVQVRKDASYNGNAPRLIAKRNDAIGLTADTVIDTFTAAVNTWELLTGVVLASPIDNGVVELYVDCDGTAGNVYVDEWAAS